MLNVSRNLDNPVLRLEDPVPFLQGKYPICWRKFRTKFFFVVRWRKLDKGLTAVVKGSFVGCARK